jgi:hypothetical protein
MLAAAAEQNDQTLSIAAEVDSVSRPEMDSALQDARSDSLHIRPVALIDARQRNGDLCSGPSIQGIEPNSEGAAALAIQIFEYLH